MDLSINQRLNEFKELKNFSWEKLRIDLGIKNAQQISSWSNLKEKIPEKHIIKIIHLFPDLNARWFITGEGDVSEQECIVSEPQALYNSRCPVCKEKDRIIEQLEKRIEDKDELLQMYRDKKKAV